MEDNMLRAVMIGVSVLITMVTLSLIILYYGTAKGIADIVNERDDIANTFDLIVNDSNTFEDRISGVEVRSLIKKYAGDKSVSINIKSPVEYSDVNNTWLEERTGTIKETMLSIINPAWQNKVTKLDTGSRIEIRVELNVKENIY